MPTKLDDIIYGADEKTDFAKFDIGKVTQAIAGDLEEFGQKGVQGVKIAPNWKTFIDYHKERTDLKSPYLQAGVVKGTLVLVLRDKKDTKVEAMDVLVKDYTKLKEKLKKSSASVTNIEGKPDTIIEDAVRDKGAKLGVTPSQDPDYGEITGDIVLIAHGAPSVMPSGRIAGVELGERKPEQIVAMLTSNKDPKKRIGKGFTGTLTLCGCFTASGGPEANRRDDPYAMKVLQLFRKKGYSKISVVGYPGATITDEENSSDSQGTATRRGDERVEAFRPDVDTYVRGEELEEEAERLLKAMNALVEPYNSARNARNELGTRLRQAIQSSGKSDSAYFKTSTGKKQSEAYKKAAQAFDKAKAAFDKAEADYAKAKKDLEDSGLGRTVANLEGRFGLRTVN